MAKKLPIRFDVKVSFGTAVKSRRSRLGISQEELAWRAGLHRTYVTDIERGARNPSLESIHKLARALKVSLSAFFEPAAESPPSDVEAGNGAQGRIVDILLVEDNREDADLTMRAFKQARLTNRVHIVGDGAEALDFLFCRGAFASRKVEERPQVVLLDLHLPKVHGFEVLRQIKNDERTRMIPVVVLTASQQDRDIREARRLGAETYLVKPVEFHNFSRITPQLQFDWALLTPSERTTI
ncbi:MAG: response regulator [Verrucomicrobia bacterium]|nr:response regulator [Verrucomicrobiota bacterium]